MKNKILNRVIKTLSYKRIFKSPKKLGRLINKQRKLNTKPYKTRFPFKVDVSRRTCGGMECYVLGEGRQYKQALIYLHGGAYLCNPAIFHWKLLQDLCVKTDTVIYVPIYPKLPQNDCTAVYEAMFNFYFEFIKAHEPSSTVIAGDSSGAALALGFNMALKEKDLACFYKSVLISPWLDIFLSDPECERIEPRDPILSISGLRILGNMWSGGQKNYRTCPIEGELTGLGEIHLFTGGLDIVYPSCKELSLKAQSAGVQDFYFYECADMCHVYPLLPLLPESKRAAGLIENIILDNKRLTL